MPYANPASYDEFMGRWSRQLAPRFLAFAELNAAKRVLDLGCGTGMLSRALVDWAEDVEVIGIDPTQSYVEFARRSASSSRARFEIGAAEVIPFEDATFDAVR